MAFSVPTHWRAKLTGSDANGGGFDAVSGTPGVDYSLQDSAQVAYTDLVIDGTTNTLGTSAGHPFTSAHVGNVVNVTGGTGFSVQRVQVVSVATGVATFDKSLGTLGSTGGTGNLGGALATPGKAAGLMIGGNVIDVQSGIYLISGSTNTAGGPLSLPGASGTANTILRGYATTPGDGGTKPILQANANSLTLITIGNSYCVVDNIELDGNSKTTCKGYSCDASTSYCTLIRVKASRFSNIGLDHQGVNGAAVIDCEVSLCTTVGPALNVPSAGCLVYGTTVHNNTVTGIHLGTNATAVACYSLSNTGASSLGFDLSSGSHCVGCTAYGNGSHNFGPMNAGVVLINCHAESSVAGEGYQSSSVTDGIHLVNCGGYANFTDNYVAANLPLTEGFQALSTSAFTVAGSDFSLNNTTAAGKLLRGAGTPTTFPAGPANYRDIGAGQTQTSNSTSTGGSGIIDDGF